MDDTRTTIAILAAGQARRFGGGKLDQLCAGRPLGGWAVLAAENAGFERRILIVGREKPKFAETLDRWDLVLNEMAEQGLPSSVRCAAYAAQASKRLVVALADMPLITANHLANLRESENILFTAYPDGTRGVPAGFPSSALERLTALCGSAAAAEWGQTISTLAPPSADMLRDVDTPADLAVVDRLLRARLNAGS
jgi:molybdenum cofactor cytidylyltransferase